ncbi:MAG: tetratricopeptide repeat protein [Spirochaetales bacterium]
MHNRLRKGAKEENIVVPRAMTYKPNSVIYFEGDSSNRIFILKSGRVTLASQDIETGEELKDRVEVGEFFGVRSALGRYPHEETAVVVSLSEVIVFSVPEFEQYVTQNTRVVLKMLKVFSTQLRRVHSKVTNMLDQPSQLSSEQGLFQTAEYFYKQRRTRQALYAFKRYLFHYPNGSNAERARTLVSQLESSASRYNSETRATPEASENGSAEDRQSARDLYNAGMSLFSRRDFATALQKFGQAAAAGDEKFTVSSLVEYGRCLLHLYKYDEAIKHFSQLVQKYPNMSELAHVLYYLGRAYEEKGDLDRAGGFFRKVQTLAPGDEQLQRQVKHAMSNL